MASAAVLAAGFAAVFTAVLGAVFAIGLAAVLAATLLAVLGAALEIFGVALAEPATFLATFLVAGRASLEELFTAIWGPLSVSGQETNPCQVNLTGLNDHYYMFPGLYN